MTRGDARVAVAACRVGFSLDRESGEHFVPNDACEDALFALRGAGWRVMESFGGVTGVIFVAEFDDLPTPDLVERVRRAIVETLRPFSGRSEDAMYEDSLEPALD